MPTNYLNCGGISSLVRAHLILLAASILVKVLVGCVTLLLRVAVHLAIELDRAVA